jgi:FkbM family methyltransferase
MPTVLNLPRRIYRRLKRELWLHELEKSLSSLPIKPVFLDVGARGGLTQTWTRLIRRGAVIGVAVELDPVEASKLQRDLPNLTCLPYALGPEIGKRTLYITKASGCTSFFEPNFQVLNSYEVRAYFDILKTIELDVTTYESLVKEGKAPWATFVKLDVQGFEKEVLKGFGEGLKNVLALEMEGHFRPFYCGQWSASEMIESMRQWGFVLRNIVPQGPFGGEFAEGNFFFSRPEKTLADDQRLLLRFWESLESIPKPPPYMPIPEGVELTQV